MGLRTSFPTRKCSFTLPLPKGSFPFSNSLPPQVLYSPSGHTGRSLGVLGIIRNFPSRLQFNTYGNLRSGL